MDNRLIYCEGYGRITVHQLKEKISWYAEVVNSIMKLKKDDEELIIDEGMVTAPMGYKDNKWGMLTYATEMFHFFSKCMMNLESNVESAEQIQKEMEEAHDVN
jgi:hypothetical protein